MISAYGYIQSLMYLTKFSQAQSILSFCISRKRRFPHHLYDDACMRTETRCLEPSNVIDSIANSDD
jgi:hypothetical protein